MTPQQHTVLGSEEIARKGLRAGLYYHLWSLGYDLSTYMHIEVTNSYLHWLGSFGSVLKSPSQHEELLVTEVPMDQQH